MGLFGSIKAWLGSPLPEGMGTPIQRFANALLLKSMEGQDGFVLCANDAQMFVSFFRDGEFTESLDPSPELAQATQARLLEMIGFDEHRPQHERLFLHLSEGRVVPFVAWIRTSATGERLTMAHYKNEAGERVLDQRPFFDELARGRRAYVAEDFDGALRSIEIALTLTDTDRYLMSFALVARLMALAALGAVPSGEQALVLQYVETALGARHPVTLRVKAERANERARFGQRDEALLLWQAVREPFYRIFGEDDPIGAELDHGLRDGVTEEAQALTDR